MAIPMTLMIGFTLHLPLVMQALNLLPAWTEIDKDMALLLIWSSIFGAGLSAVIYLGSQVPKPVKFPIPALQDWVAYDFYTPKIYRNTVILVVGIISQLTAWFDKYLVDGVVNFFGFITLLVGQTLKYFTSGQSQFYALTIILGIAFMSVWLCFPMLAHMSLTTSLSSLVSNAISLRSN